MSAGRFTRLLLTSTLLASVAASGWSESVKAAEIKAQASGDWFDPAIWNPNTVPGSGDRAVVHDESVEVSGTSARAPSNKTAQALHLQLGLGSRGGQLRILNGATLFVRSATAESGNNPAKILVFGSGSRLVVDDRLWLKSRGVLELADGGMVEVKNEPILVSSSNNEIRVGNGGAPGTLLAPMISFRNGSRLEFNHTDVTGAYIFTPDIVSTGSAAAEQILHKAGYTRFSGDASGFRGKTTVSGGTFALEGRLGGTLEINSGATFAIGAGSGKTAGAPGTLSVPAVNLGVGGGTLVFNHDDLTGNYVFAPVISKGSDGRRRVLHEAGYTVLTGDSSGFAGTTTLSGGTLALNGKLSGIIDVAGGTLGGTGTLEGGLIFVRSGGRVAPGMSIGTLTAGGILFQPGSVFAVEVNGAQSDL